MRKGAIVVFVVVAVIGAAILALRRLNFPDTSSSTITQREVRVKDAVVFHNPPHDSSKFIAFVEAAAEKRGAAPLQECQEELLLIDKSYKSSARKEFGAGDSHSAISVLVFAPRDMYRKDAKVRLVCKTTATDWYPVELPELKHR